MYLADGLIDGALQCLFGWLKTFLLLKVDFELSFLFRTFEIILVSSAAQEAGGKETK